MAGSGQNPGVAIDGVGTAYIGWQVDTYGDNDHIEVCLLPAKAKACETVASVSFPGQGYNRSRVTLIASGPSTVDVIVPRTDTGTNAATYLARSIDGGRTFARGIRISATDFAQGAAGPNGPSRSSAASRSTSASSPPTARGPRRRALPHRDPGRPVARHRHPGPRRDRRRLAARGSAGVAAAAGADPNAPTAGSACPTSRSGASRSSRASAHGLVAMIEPPASTATGCTRSGSTGNNWTSPCA